ncbi:protein of unknown function [Atopostipes suicloacalis DSM 15692]|uniref:Transcobalamin-like C-terminal domain-containing protein n=1 Tax=Atopostipes suicloacalis DSM 15692 TaxID=1121025 RepID=A0A1M4UFQ3_9LACT|nr:DUF4430 domain-containing protein [Atopostipes suicloacalis]SHE55433.1 protein of unknown function [Atopostipes suicloacalis DSM 15692]
MDKKLLSKLFLFSLSGALLVGCGNQAEETPEEAEEPETEVAETPEETEETTDTEDAADEVSFTIDILVDGEAVADLSKEVTAEEGMYLLDVMEDTYDIEETDGFISSIEGYEQDEAENRYWLYYINGESGEVGAADYAPEAADQIEWRLESFE